LEDSESIFALENWVSLKSSDMPDCYPRASSQASCLGSLALIVLISLSVYKSGCPSWPATRDYCGFPSQDSWPACVRSKSTPHSSNKLCSLSGNGTESVGVKLPFSAWQDTLCCHVPVAISFHSAIPLFWGPSETHSLDRCSERCVHFARYACWLHETDTGAENLYRSLLQLV
jgi:hypothetical protein